MSCAFTIPAKPLLSALVVAACHLACRSVFAIAIVGLADVPSGGNNWAD